MPKLIFLMILAQNFPRNPMVGEHKFFVAILADFFADFEKILADFLKSSKIANLPKLLRLSSKISPVTIHKKTKIKA